MSNRFAFIANRQTHLQSLGMSTDEACDKANQDYRTMSKLSRNCTPNHDDLIRAGKGTTLCNRTACQAAEHVVFFNSVMHKNYCLACATDIRFCNDLSELDLYPDYNETLDKLFEDTTNG
jgi:hypothetical protein